MNKLGNDSIKKNQKIIPKICVNLRHLRLKKAAFRVLYSVCFEHKIIKKISENPRNPRNQRIKKQPLHTATASHSRLYSDPL
jgi:hypothetical protein